MSDGAAFLRSILDNPADEVPDNINGGMAMRTGR